MKKIFTLAVATIISVTAFSQTSKGTWLAGGAANFTSQSQGGNSISQINITPNVGYFVNDNFAVGGTVNLGSQSGSGSTFTSFGIGPMARYYFAEIGKKAKLYGQAEFAYASVSGGGSSQSGTGWGLQAGPAFFLTKNVALETTLRYGSISVGGSSANTFGVNVGFQIHL